MSAHIALHDIEQDLNSAEIFSEAACVFDQRSLPTIAELDNVLNYGGPLLDEDQSLDFPDQTLTDKRTDSNGDQLFAGKSQQNNPPYLHEHQDNLTSIRGDQLLAANFLASDQPDDSCGPSALFTGHTGHQRGMGNGQGHCSMVSQETNNLYSVPSDLQSQRSSNNLLTSHGEANQYLMKTAVLEDADPSDNLFQAHTLTSDGGNKGRNMTASWGKGQSTVRQGNVFSDSSAYNIDNTDSSRAQLNASIFNPSLHQQPETASTQTPIHSRVASPISTARSSQTFMLPVHTTVPASHTNLSSAHVTVPATCSVNVSSQTRPPSMVTSLLLALMGKAVSDPKYSLPSEPSALTQHTTVDSPLLRQLISAPYKVVQTVNTQSALGTEETILDDSDCDSSDAEETPAKVLSKLECKIKCECRFNGGDPCWQLFNEEKLKKERLHHLKMSKNTLDLVLLAKIAATMNWDEKTKRSTNERQRCRLSYHHEGRQICRETFLFIHGICGGRLMKLMKHYRKEGISNRVHGNKNLVPHHAMSEEDQRKAIDFIQEYAERNSMSSYGRKPGSKANGGVLILSQKQSKKYVHYKYKVWCAKSNQRAMSFRSFTILWAKHLSSIIVLRGSNKTPVPSSDVDACVEEGNEEMGGQGQSLEDYYKVVGENFHPHVGVEASRVSRECNVFAHPEVATSSGVPVHTTLQNQIFMSGAQPSTSQALQTFLSRSEPQPSASQALQTFLSGTQTSTGQALQTLLSGPEPQPSSSQALQMLLSEQRQPPTTQPLQTLLSGPQPSPTQTLQTLQEDGDIQFLPGSTFMTLEDTTGHTPVDTETRPVGDGEGRRKRKRKALPPRKVETPLGFTFSVPEERCVPQQIFEDGPSMNSEVSGHVSMTTIPTVNLQSRSHHVLLSSLSKQPQDPEDSEAGHLSLGGQQRQVTTTSPTLTPLQHVEGLQCPTRQSDPACTKDVQLCSSVSPNKDSIITSVSGDRSPTLRPSFGLSQPASFSVLDPYLALPCPDKFGPPTFLAPPMVNLSEQPSAVLLSHPMTDLANLASIDWQTFGSL